jgi:hypothetical protein
VAVRRWLVVGHTLLVVGRLGERKAAEVVH